MDWILIAALTALMVAIFMGVAYALNSLLHVKGITVYPLLRFRGKGEMVQTPSRFSQHLDVIPLVSGGESLVASEGGEDMVPVEQIMQKEPFRIQSDASVRTVAKLMVQHEVGSCLVEDRQGMVQGIVTETDIVRKVTAAALPPAVVQVDQVMSAPVITIDRASTVTDADALMDQHHTRHLGVTDNGRIIGILSVRDWLHPIHEEQRV